MSFKKLSRLALSVTLLMGALTTSSFAVGVEFLYPYSETQCRPLYDRTTMYLAVTHPSTQALYAKVDIDFGYNLYGMYAGSTDFNCYQVSDRRISCTSKLRLDTGDAPIITAWAVPYSGTAAVFRATSYGRTGTTGNWALHETRTKTFSVCP